jgi:hypothetical protein
MRSRGRFMLFLIVVLSATGSAAPQRDSFADAARSSIEQPTIVHSQTLDLPWATQADIRERQMLAWIILLMKEGREAR